MYAKLINFFITRASVQQHARIGWKTSEAVMSEKPTMTTATRSTTLLYHFNCVQFTLSHVRALIITIGYLRLVQSLSL